MMYDDDITIWFTQGMNWRLHLLYRSYSLKIGFSFQGNVLHEYQMDSEHCRPVKINRIIFVTLLTARNMTLPL